MLFAWICTDKPGHLEMRLKVRPDHVAFLDKLGTALKGAGPFTDEEGKPTGSLVLVESASLADAKALAAQDPYAQAGLFQSVEIRPWKWLIRNPETT